MNGKVVLALFAALSVGCRSDGSYRKVLEGFGDSVGDFPRCREDAELVLNGITERKEWALRMADSSTKAPVGLLTGNLMDYGNFDECIGARSGDGRISPQHCMASLRLNNSGGDNSSLNIPIVYRWSYCIPDSCPAAALESVLARVVTEIVPEANLSVATGDCQTGDPDAMSSTDVFGICVWIFFACLALASTAYDVIALLRRKATNPWLVSFSLYTNIGRLMNTELSKGTLTPVNGLRFLSMAWIILGHRFFLLSMSSVMNLIEVPREFDKIYFQILIGGVLAVDTFFLMSGMLNSYLLLKVMDERKKFPVGTFYLHRYLRTTPPLAAVILMLATWYAYIGSGPMWDRMTWSWRKLCVDYWWPTLLYINNYYNPLEQCAGQTWYLAVDMQLYWISPLVILPIWKYPRLRHYYLGALLMLSVASQFSVAYMYKFRMAFSISLDFEEAGRISRLLYVPTHTRATPYIIGIMLGMYLHDLRKAPNKPQLPKVLVLFGWLMSTTLCLSVLFGNYPFFRSEEYHPYNRFESSLYIGFHRLAWGLGISWIIYACLFGYGGVVNSILSWKLFAPLSRLTYCMFLCHMSVQQYALGTSRTTTYYRTFDVIHAFLGDLILSAFAALILCLLFEFPLSAMEKLALRGSNRPEVKIKTLQSYYNEGYQGT